VRSWRPDLLELTGGGPIGAATALTAWSHPGRCRDDAAFAMLAGTAPIPASSGKTVRYRLNRSGDRQLDRALHTVTLSRLHRGERTRAHADRRRAEGRTDREIRRCRQRHIARELHRRLESPPPVARRGRGASGPDPLARSLTHDGTLYGAATH
jgi:transposase